MSTVDHAEITQFDHHAQDWWDEEGPFAPLHQMNPARIQFIQDTLKSHTKAPYNTLSMLDIGCGGGLITEPFSRLGATVTGLDAAPETINRARQHAAETGLSINYVHTPLEEFIPTAQFDIVCALEIVEHVADIDLFIKHCARVLKPDGLLFVSTLNRTVQSYLEAIIGAEYILKWVPRGTHQWDKFLKPSTLCQHLERQKMRAFKMGGFSYNPLEKTWRLTKTPKTNYIVAAKFG